MHHRTDTLLKFVRAVRRRMVLLRLLERMGMAIAGAAALSLLLAGVLIWRGQPAANVVSLFLSLAGAAGLVWGLMNRPTLLAAAEEADRQLRLADLLSTAMSVGEQTFDEPFAHTVHNLAVARCAALSPSALVLRKLTGRAWSGIGLTTALAVSAALLSSRPSLLQAQPGNSPFVALDRLNDPTAERAGGSPAWPDLTARPRGDAGTESDVGRTGNNSEANSGTTKTGDGGTGNSNSSDGQGTGSASTPDGGGPRDPMNVPGTHAKSGGTGPAAGGVGEAAGDAAVGEGGSTSTSGSPLRAATPPWRSADWTNRQADALHAVESGEIPDAYRDLVREYFSGR